MRHNKPMIESVRSPAGAATAISSSAIEKSLACVTGREQCVVQQREALAERDRIADGASLVDDRSQFIERAASVIGRLGGEPRAEPQPQIGSLPSEVLQGVAHQREVRGTLVGDPELVQPQPSGSDRRLGERDRVAGLLRGVGRGEELRASRRQPSAGQCRARPYEER